jgi:hypothetical protein
LLAPPSPISSERLMAGLFRVLALALLRTERPVKSKRERLVMTQTLPPQDATPILPAKMVQWVSSNMPRQGANFPAEKRLGWGWMEWSCYRLAKPILTRRALPGDPSEHQASYIEAVVVSVRLFARTRGQAKPSASLGISKTTRLEFRHGKSSAAPYQVRLAWFCRQQISRRNGQVEHIALSLGCKSRRAANVPRGE